jgi:alcohol dehydrogenase (NADP+)
MKKEHELILLEDPAVIRIAQTHGYSPAQVLLRWAIERSTAVIPKSVNPARLQENFQAANLERGDQDMADLAKLDVGYRYVDGEFWTIEGSPYTLAGLWE